MSSTPISFVRIATPQIVQRMAPRHGWVLHVALAASLLIASLGGIVLGVLAATGLGVGGDRWLATVQGHGDLQLWGWFAVFITALTFEFIVRLNGRPAISLGPRVAVLLLLGSGALVSAAGRVAGTQRIVLSGAVFEVAGAALFAFLVFHVPPARPLREDLHPGFFRAGSAWLLVAAVSELLAALAMQSGTTPVETLHVAVECVLRGFVLNVTVAVGLRAFPGHLGLPPVAVRSQRVIGVSLNGSLALWVMSNTLPGGLPSTVLGAVGDLVLGGALVWSTLALGIPGAVRSWRRARERPQLLIPIAWLGLVVYAIGLISGAAFVMSGGVEPSLLTAGAVRHVFMLGFVGPLLIAMSHVVLERFGTGQLRWRNALTAAFVLLIVAWPLRVVPPLVDDIGSAASQGMMGLAGILVAAALAMAAAATVRNAVAVAAFERQFRASR